MRLIGKSLILLSYLSLNVSPINAKTLDLCLNQTINENIDIQEKNAPKQFSITNEGTHKISQFLPLANGKQIWTLEKLAKEITETKHPLLALYQIWSKSVLRVESNENSFKSNPLDYINFYGRCTSEEYERQFIHLCQLLGIDTRQVSKHGKTTYDFCLKGDEWTYLDLTQGQFYLGWDNKTTISSEHLMDDPLLVLRSKTQKRAPFNLTEAWQLLAQLKIVDFDAEENESFEPFIESNSIEGFDFYPQEKLTYQELKGLFFTQVVIDHELNWNARTLANDTTYLSPFPIVCIENHSTGSLYIENLDVTIPSGESHVFEESIFKLNLKSDATIQGNINVKTVCNKKLFPLLETGKNTLKLAPENTGKFKVTYEVEEDQEEKNLSEPSIAILNTTTQFESSPVFHLANSENSSVKKMHWQISTDKNFAYVPFSLEGEEEFSPALSLSLLEETFITPDETYYFRVRGSNDQIWSDWTTPYTFTVQKPKQVKLVEFDEINANTFELNWGREVEIEENPSDAPIEYLVFGSNAFDFIPSIYSPTQVNEIKVGLVPVQETNENLITITTDTKIQVDGKLAYYRIIARQNGQLSVPSPIIHVYGSNLIQPRTVLQMVESGKKLVTKRVLIPSTYEWTETALPRIGVVNRLYENSLLELHNYISATAVVNKNDATTSSYIRPSHVSKDLWNKMKPYFLPENHPWKKKIDRIFSASRASKNSSSLKEAGFKGQITRVRKIFAGVHAECVECFFKIYTDSEVSSRYTEWQKWLDRIRGKNNVAEVIKKHGYEKWFSVPEKWCYPLPEKPAAPAASKYYKPKDFILVCSNQRPYDHYENEKMWKTKITYEMLDAIYIVMYEAGMWDSMFIFNIPFSKIDGKICFVDTEYSHKWPLRFEKLSKYLSSSNRKYWEYLIKNHGPKGYKNPFYRF